jgi:hypothetical protein
MLLPSGERPEPRSDHTLAAVTRGKALVLFGGRDAAGASVGDTWVYRRTGDVWNRLDASGPAPRFGHAVASSSDDGFFLFGGQSADQFFNDLWHFDSRSGEWSLVDDGANAAPAPRYGASLVAGGDSLLLSHGFTFEGRFDDTWRWDIRAGSWEDITPSAEAKRPLKRCLHESVWDATTNSMLLFGGCSSGFGPCPQGDLWSFDPAERVWSEISLPSAPAARSNPSLVYDDGRGQILLFGGLTEAGADASLWSLRSVESGLAWTEWRGTSEAPPPRSSHDAVMTGPHLNIFGGLGSEGPLNDLWTLDVRELEAS